MDDARVPPRRVRGDIDLLLQDRDATLVPLGEPVGDRGPEDPAADDGYVPRLHPDGAGFRSLLWLCTRDAPERDSSRARRNPRETLIMALGVHRRPPQGSLSAGNPSGRFPGEGFMDGEGSDRRFEALREGLLRGALEARALDSVGPSFGGRNRAPRGVGAMI